MKVTDNRSLYTDTPVKDIPSGEPFSGVFAQRRSNFVRWGIPASWVIIDLNMPTVYYQGPNNKSGDAVSDYDPYKNSELILKD